MTVQDDREQLFLELVNRARLDPAAEAARYGLSDLSAGTGTTITTEAKQVLARNSLLYNSATAHNNYMISAGVFSHTGSGGSAPVDRMIAAGYGGRYEGGGLNFYSGENLAWRGTTGALDATAEVYNEHRDLFLSAGHRRNIMNVNYEELGVSAIVANGYLGYNGLVTTHNFGALLDTPVFVTGVHYTDSDLDAFYSVGEGGSGRTVQIFSGSTLLTSGSTSSSGGYQVQTTATTPVEVVFAGGGLAASAGAIVTPGTKNLKLDLVNGTNIETNVSATLSRDALNLKLLSIDAVNGTGNALNNTIVGNKAANQLSGGLGNDILSGNDGDDTLNGGDGNDSISGGTGNDIAVFAGALTNYVIVYNSSSQVYSFYGIDGAVDTVQGVENFSFADGLRSAATLPLSGSAPLRQASVVATAASVVEGNAGTTILTFEVRLDAAAYSAQSVAFAIAGSGTNPANNADFSGPLSGTVHFAAGETVRQISVAVAGDIAVEANEAFTVSLSTPSAGLNIVGSSASATIIDDDVAYTSGADLISATSGTDALAAGAGNDWFAFAPTTLNAGDRVTDYAAGDTIYFASTTADPVFSIAGSNVVVNGLVLEGAAAANVSAVTQSSAGLTAASGAAVSAVMVSGHTGLAALGAYDVFEFDANADESWLTRELNYNSSGQLTRSVETAESGDTTTIVYDTNGQDWAYERSDRNAGGAITFNQFMKDDGSRVNTAFDTGTMGDLSYTIDEFSATGILTYRTDVYDDGTIMNTVYSAAGAGWYSVRIATDDARTQTTYDPEGVNAWFAIRTFRDPANNPFREEQFYDDDTRSYILNDYGSNSWQQIETVYDSQGRVDLERYLYDSGARTVTDTDQADLYPTWRYHVTEYAASGAVTADYYVV